MMMVFTTTARQAAVVGVLLLLLLSSPWTHAKLDRSLPHTHNGKLTSYEPGPFANLQLSDKEEATLREGKAVMKQSSGGSSGGAICIQDIAAPKAAVWNQILDLANYKQKVGKVLHSSNYHVSKTPHQAQKIKTRMVLGVVPGYSYESYYDHTFYPEHDSLTWRLDYSKTSDMDDVSGHWHLQALEDQKTRVYYACDIMLKASVPGPVVNYLSKAALKQATSWVKKESEEHATQTDVAASYGYSATTTTTTKSTTPHQPKSTNRPWNRAPAFFRRGGASLLLPSWWSQ